MRKDTALAFPGGTEAAAEKLRRMPRTHSPGRSLRLAGQTDAPPLREFS
jgi:hypothetical protein